MDKLKLHSKNITDENIESIAQLFPNCVTEVEAVHNGEKVIKKAIDFDMLRQELSASIVEGQQERYQLNWPGKREALLAANAPIAKTLRPDRDESVDFDTTENLFIEGDNLEALKLLQETYLGKVKMIYIDPPYNTGKDFIYEDDFAEDAGEYLIQSEQKDSEGNRLVANTESNGRFHSDWLSMMYSRLRLARNLMEEDGLIFISLDDGESHNNRKLCDEIFGEENFIANFIWEKRITRENRKVVSNRHDHIFCYCKNRNSSERIIGLLPMNDEAISRYKNPDNDGRGVWTSVPAIAQAGHGTKNQFYTLVTPSGRTVDPPSGSCWRYTKEKMNEAIKENRIWFGADGSGVPRIKKFLNEGQQGLTVESMWWAKEVGTNDSAKRDLTKLFDGKAVFETPKPSSLITRMLQIGTEENSIILDFFAGTSPTAHAVMQMNADDGSKRKFIMVQLDEKCDEESVAFKAGYKTIADISKERIRRAGKKIKEENPDKADNLDTGFRVLKIADSNMHDVYYSPDAVSQKALFDTVDNIKDDRTEEDLLFQVLLDWGVDLTLPIVKEKVCGQYVFFVDDDALTACFAGEGKITDELCRELAGRHPLRVVFRDSGFKDDSVKINAEQIFKQLSPNTDIKVI